MYIFKKLAILQFILIFICDVAAQEKRFTISGTVTDTDNGEDIIGVNIYVASLKTGVATNSYGFYSLSLPAGNYALEFSYLGYESQIINVNLSENKKIDIKLKIADNVLSEIVVSGEKKNQNVVNPEMSVQKLTSKVIKTIPAMMGEVDVIKAIQLLPGVQSVSEGSSSLSVRGGGHDQNLILLDESTVYNASHLMGFFSVFNNDIVRDVKLYKGDIPATFGGRLSSLMEVYTKEGNNQKYAANGGIGTISSRLMLEGPIVKDKASFIVAGRRTYADLFLLLSNDDGLSQSRLYFYDLNFKVNYRINSKNRIFMSGYLGNDVFGNSIADMGFGNKTFTLRWNHILTPKLFSNFTFVGSQYDYLIGIGFNEHISQYWKSKMRDFGGKADFTFHLNPQNNINFGYNYAYHVFFPGKGGGVGEKSIIKKFELPQKYACDHALYISNETTIAKKLVLRYGLRYSAFQNIGNGKKEYLLNNYEVVDSAVYKKGKIYFTQSRFEPRTGINYIINDQQSIKASYSRTAQYIQLASNSAAGSPLDVWFQVSKNIKPQLNDQFAIGYFRNFSKNTFESSVEIYYRNMKNVVDFKDRASLMGNSHIDEELRFGTGEAYGIEFLLRKNTGNFTGWISYTYSRSFRKIDEVNKGERYRSPYDRPNNISIVLSYEIRPKLTASASWVYATGIPVTYPTGRFEVEGTYVPIYSKRNEYRYPDYHRMDLAVVWTLSKPYHKFKHELNFSLYNAYGRKNPWTIFFQQEEDNTDVTYAEMLYLFSFVPSVTWNFWF